MQSDLFCGTPDNCFIMANMAAIVRMPNNSDVRDFLCENLGPPPPPMEKVRADPGLMSTNPDLFQHGAIPQKLPELHRESEQESHSRKLALARDHVTFMERLPSDLSVNNTASM